MRGSHGATHVVAKRRGHDGEHGPERADGDRWDVASERRAIVPEKHSDGHEDVGDGDDGRGEGPADEREALQDGDAADSNALALEGDARGRGERRWTRAGRV